MDVLTLPLNPSGSLEPLAITVSLDGDRIVDARIRHGALHRGIEEMALHWNLFQVLPLAERICGFCSLSNALTFARAVETIAGIVVPPRARYLRTLFLELERISSHFLWLATACHIAGHEALMMAVLSLRERVLDMLEGLTGKRSNCGVAAFGGTRVNLDDADIKALEEMIAFYRRELPPLQEVLVEGPLLRFRLQGVGVLPKEVAVRHGVVGPVARASGLYVDLRWSSPYEAYGDFDVQPRQVSDLMGRSRGDAFDRMVLRIMELRQSLEIIETLLQGIPGGNVLAVKKDRRLAALLRDAEGRALVSVEGPRGESLQRVTLCRGKIALSSWTLRSATYVNASSWPLLLRGEELSDVALIINSTDPCIACTERLFPLRPSPVPEMAPLRLSSAEDGEAAKEVAP